jgi:hypothetical protein
MPAPGGEQNWLDVTSESAFSRHGFLLLLDLTNRRGDLGGRENRGRHLVEKRLKDVMIAPVDQNDLGITSSQGRAATIPAKPPPMMTTRFCFVGAGSGRDNVSRGRVSCTSLIFVSSDRMAQSREARTSAAVTLPCLPPKCPMT